MPRHCMSETGSNVKAVYNIPNLNTHDITEFICNESNML